VDWQVLMRRRQRLLWVCRCCGHPGALLTGVYITATPTPGVADRATDRAPDSRNVQLIGLSVSFLTARAAPLELRDPQDCGSRSINPTAVVALQLLSHRVKRLF